MITSSRSLSSHSLDRPDATIRYWISRPDGRSTAPTVVLLHGATLDHHAWEPQVTALQDRFTLVVPDLRAHGESTGTFGFTAAVADVQALLDRLPTERVVLVGLSLGGNIAQEIVRLDPDRVHALVVADATCNTAARYPLEVSTGVAALRLQAMLAGPDFARQAAAATAIDPQVQRYALEANRSRSSQVTLAILTSLLTSLRPDPVYRLPVPTLLLHGQADPMGDIAGGTAAWARREPLAEYAVIPDAGHASNLDNPEVFTEKLEGFLLRVLPEVATGGLTGGDGPDGTEAQAERLYARYGAHPWQLLPESTREHFRGLIAAGIDGSGRPLLQDVG